MSAVHNLSTKEITRFALDKWRQGEFGDVTDAANKDSFFSCIERFSVIAAAFREHPRTLDVGSGGGHLAALLKMLGHQASAVDFKDRRADALYLRHDIPFAVCNIEADRLPFDDEALDAVSCCQAMEHFTHSHLPPTLEMKRVLRKGGVLEIDVPNAVSFRSRSRMLRGKHITWDYRQSYLHQKPVEYKGREYYPDRHNREFTLPELKLLLEEAGFDDIEVRFLADQRIRHGLHKILSLGSALRDLIPSIRKSLIAIGRKPRG